MGRAMVRGLQGYRVEGAYASQSIGYNNGGEFRIGVVAAGAANTAGAGKH